MCVRILLCLQLIYRKSYDIQRCVASQMSEDLCVGIRALARENNEKIIHTELYRFNLVKPLNGNATFQIGRFEPYTFLRYALTN